MFECYLQMFDKESLHIILVYLYLSILVYFYVFYVFLKVI